MGSHQLESFLAFVQKTCPWLLEEETINEQTWQKVGLQLKQRFTLHGPPGLSYRNICFMEFSEGKFGPLPRGYPFAG